MQICAKFEEEVDMAKGYLQEQDATMVREGKEIKADKGEEEGTEWQEVVSLMDWSKQS
jgi:hypothetical protein